MEAAIEVRGFPYDEMLLYLDFSGKQGMKNFFVSFPGRESKSRISSLLCFDSVSRQIARIISSIRTAIDNLERKENV